MTPQMLILAVALATGTLERQATARAAPKPSSNTTDDRLATVPAPAMVVVEGCVATRRELTGGPTDMTERIGLNEHFVLTSARVLKGRAPAGLRKSDRTTFAIAGLSDEQLTPHLGRRVRIEGSFAKGEPSSDAGKPQPLAALSVGAVRQVAGDCPARQRATS